MTDDDQFLADLHTIADRAHANHPDASSTPNSWSRVLATTNLKSESETKTGRRTPMKTYPAQPMQPAWGEPISTDPRSRSFGGTIRRFTSLAATVALVCAIAIGGWLAMMQLQPSNPDPRFAVIPATPEGMAQTCDVEPLSVDRVMEIVRNPAYFMANGPTADRAESAMGMSPPDAELWKVDAALGLLEVQSVPSQSQHDAAALVANEYLTCMVFGTQGQVWSFYSPAYIQTSILAEFPVFADEAEVMARIEERLNEPGYTGEAVWANLQFIGDIEEVSVNPERELAILKASQSWYFDQVMQIGISFKDADGKPIALTNGTGRDLIPNDPYGGKNDITLFINVAKVRNADNDTWVIIPWPSEAELGF